MSKIKLFYLLIFAFLSLISCELIKITEKRTYQIKPDPTKSIGAIALLSKELNEGNIQGATKLICIENKAFHPDSIMDIEEKLILLARKIHQKPITYFKIDTLDTEHHKIQVEYDYLFDVIFETQKIESNWFVRNFFY